MVCFYKYLLVYAYISKHWLNQIIKTHILCMYLAKSLEQANLKLYN